MNSHIVSTTVASFTQDETPQILLYGGLVFIALAIGGAFFVRRNSSVEQAERAATESAIMAKVSIMLSTALAEEAAIRDKATKIAEDGMLADIEALLYTQREEDMERHAETVEVQGEMAKATEIDILAKVEDLLHGRSKEEFVQRNTEAVEFEASILEKVQAKATSIIDVNCPEFKEAVRIAIKADAEKDSREMDAALLKLFDDYKGAFWTNPNSLEIHNKNVDIIKRYVYDGDSEYAYKPSLADSITYSLFPESASYARAINRKKGLSGVAVLTAKDKIQIIKRVIQRICIITNGPNTTPNAQTMITAGYISLWSKCIINSNIWEAAPIVHLGKIYIKITYNNFNEIYIDPTTAANYSSFETASTGGVMVPIVLPEA